MYPFKDWNTNCGYEEALHSNGGTSTACERGPVWPGDSVIWLKLLSVDAREVERVFPLGTN